MQNPIFWKVLNLRPGFWIERSLYRSWNIYNISQFNLQSINIGKSSFKSNTGRKNFQTWSNILTHSGKEKQTVLITK